MTRNLRAADDPSLPKPPEASAEVMQQRLDEMRAIAGERPDASVYVDVKNGRARISLPSGDFVIVKEGEAIRIWPHYSWRPEGGGAS